MKQLTFAAVAVAVAVLTGCGRDDTPRDNTAASSSAPFPVTTAENVPALPQVQSSNSTAAAESPSTPAGTTLPAGTAGAPATAAAPSSLPPGMAAAPAAPGATSLPGGVASADANSSSATTAMGAGPEGQATYAKACVACHDAGVAGAPKVGDKADWATRSAQGKNTLYDHAIKGYTGKKGMMPPKGGNTSLSDAQVKAAVDYMLDKSK